MDNEMIERRDALITQALRELNAFPEADLPIKSYESRLTVSSNAIFVPPIIYNEEWASNRIEKIAEDVKKRVVIQILEQVDDLKTSDFILRGSIYNVAWKLTCKFFFGDRSWMGENSDCEDVFDYQNKFELLKVNFRSLYDEVASRYEKKCMKYRLWDKSSIESLYNYSISIFEGSTFDLDGYYPEFDSYALDENGNYPSLSKEEFIEMLNEAIEVIPQSESTELPLPFWNHNSYFNYDSGVVVGEYAPLSMAEDTLLDNVYNDYLKEAKLNEKISG